jgi:hypothetical protein
MTTKFAVPVCTIPDRHLIRQVDAVSRMLAAVRKVIQAKEVVK